MSVAAGRGSEETRARTVSSSRFLGFAAESVIWLDKRGAGRVSLEPGDRRKEGGDVVRTPRSTSGESKEGRQSLKQERDVSAGPRGGTHGDVVVGVALGVQGDVLCASRGRGLAEHPARSCVVERTHRRSGRPPGRSRCSARGGEGPWRVSHGRGC